MEDSVNRWRKLGEFVRSFSDQTKLTLAVSTIVAMGLACEWVSKYKGGPQSLNDPRLLIAIRELEKGTVLTQLDLTTVTGKKDEAPQVFNDQQLPIVLGSKLKYRLRKGEPVTHDALELAGRRKNISERIPEGLRAYSFKPENELPLQLGDRIDLLHIPTKGVAHSIISGVEVLDLKKNEAGQVLIIAVTEDDLPELEKARQTGKLVIALRGSQESIVPGSRKRRVKTSSKARPSIQMFLEEAE